MRTNKITVGILAHVDAGKTTLSESLLYLSGSIRTMGRVDHKNAFLDTFELEKARGITIFSKQAVFSIGDRQVTLMDTPGHVDFSSEMERTLQVLDYAILVINGADGVQGHTLTLWKLLKRYEIPTFLFVNKMDQIVTDRDKLIGELEKRLSERCIDFGSDIDPHALGDRLAMCDEHLMEQFLALQKINQLDIRLAIANRKVFPVFFGSALKSVGVQAFLEGLENYLMLREYPASFGAKIYKITRDNQDNRLTHMKITGGSLKVKDVLTNEKTSDNPNEFDHYEEIWKEKVDQIRIYSGSQFQTVNEAVAGTICAVTGLTKTCSGEGLGLEVNSPKPVLKPVLTYKILLPEGCDVHGILGKLRQLEEEEPLLNIVWNEVLGEIQAQVMGEIEIEILKSMILDRYGVEVSFGSGSLMYRETIAELVEGVGHFEPLRHYAEVHLLLEPGELGSGLQFETSCSEDILDRNWQRLVLTHLREKRQIGVLTGSEITDIKITLVTGRAHLKHTEGGDFRQATYRAVRQGLKKAKSILLEPVYEYRLEVQREMLGRAMADIQRMQGKFDEPIFEGDTAVLVGTAPVATMQGYSTEVISYTKGCGRLVLSLKGYEPCHNAEEMIAVMDYDSEMDIENPTYSIFCTHGVGFNVNWDRVEEYMHVESGLNLNQVAPKKVEMRIEAPRNAINQGLINDQELEEIFFRTYGTTKREPSRKYKSILESPKESSVKKEETHYKMKVPIKSVNREKYLLVDGYNIIFAWDELKEMAKSSLDVARLRLMDLLCNYQSLKDETVILVFDAYKVVDNSGEMTQYHNIHVVFTKEAETADQYIEKLVHYMSHQYDVTVATSDALEQMIIMGQGARRLSAQGLKDEVEGVNQYIREHLLNLQEEKIHFPFRGLEDLGI